MHGTHDITSLDALLDLYPQVKKISLDKETNKLTPEYHRWLAASPFFALASSGASGLDCTPRGDEKGQLIKILDDTSLAIPDRRGNNRLDTLRNLVTDPRVSLLFLIPGINETLRINGIARITTDPLYLDQFVMKGTRPTTVILVDIQSVYFQCARALIRSKLWDPALFQQKKNIPTAGQMTKSANPEFDAESYDQALPSRQKSTLY